MNSFSISYKANIGDKVLVKRGKNWEEATVWSVYFELFSNDYPARSLYDVELNRRKKNGNFISMRRVKENEIALFK